MNSIMPPMIPLVAEGDTIAAAVRASTDNEAARLKYAAWLARVGCHEQAKLIASPVGIQMAAFCSENDVPVRVMLDMEVGAVADAAAGPEHYRATAALMRSCTGRASVFRALIGEVNSEAIAATNKLIELLREASVSLDRPGADLMALLGDMFEAAKRVNDAHRRLAKASLAEAERPAVF